MENPYTHPVTRKLPGELRPEVDMSGASILEFWVKDPPQDWTLKKHFADWPVERRDSRDSMCEDLEELGKGGKAPNVLKEVFVLLQVRW